MNQLREIQRAYSLPVQSHLSENKGEIEWVKELRSDSAFYIATKGGGEFFGKVGSFEEGYEFDALMLDDSILAHPLELNIRQRIEPSIYLSLDMYGGIKEKYIQGNKVV